MKITITASYEIECGSHWATLYSNVHPIKDNDIIYAVHINKLKYRTNLQYQIFDFKSKLWYNINIR